MRRVQLLQRCFVMVLFMGFTMLQASGQQASQDGKRLEVFELDPDLRIYIFEILRSEFKTFQMGANSVAVVETPERLQRAREMVQILNKIEGAQGGQTQTNLVVSVVGASLNESFAEGTALPESLRPLATELKAMFPYQTYRLLDSMPVRMTSSTLDDRSLALMFQASSRLGRCTSDPLTQCIQNIGISRAIAGEPVKLFNFSYGLRVPRPQQPTAAAQDGKGDGPVYEQLAFTTSVDIAKGQTLVVGKLNPENAQTAYFIAVTRLKN